MTKLGYLYLHAPDPEKRGQYVTYRIAVEVEEDDQPDTASDETEADNDPA